MKLSTENQEAEKNAVWSGHAPCGTGVKESNDCRGRRGDNSQLTVLEQRAKHVEWTDAKMSNAMAQSSGLALTATVLLLAAAAAASLPQASAFPQPGSAAQELEKLLLEKVVRAEAESKVVNRKSEMTKDQHSPTLTNEGSNDIDIDEVLRQKSSEEIDKKEGDKEDEENKESGLATLLETLPGAELQFRDTFSFLKAAYTSTESPREPEPANQLKKPRVFAIVLPSGNYTGELDGEGLRDGWGEMYFKNGSLYGPGGIFIYGEGDRYVGQWQNDTQHGMKLGTTC